MSVGRWLVGTEVRERNRRVLGHDQSDVDLYGIPQRDARLDFGTIATTGQDTLTKDQMLREKRPTENERAKTTARVQKLAQLMHLETLMKIASMPLAAILNQI
jgi:hypothetical protein